MTEITDYIHKKIQPFLVTERIASVQEFFEGSPFSHFPVVEEKIYLGCISAEDVDVFDTNKTIGDYKYALDQFLVKNDLLWLDVLENFTKNKTNIMPVLDNNNGYLGYYEILDVIHFFNNTTFLKEIGDILIIEKDINNYSMSEIVQIVESNNSKILGIFISDSDTDKIQITLKLSLGNTDKIIQSFRRYLYTIVSEHKEDIYINELKNRSEYLTKYLNI